jgi:hypothetical protein
MMRRALILVVAVWYTLSGPTLVYGQSISPDSNTEKELRALRQKFFDGLKRGDRVLLEELLADGFVFVHSTGVKEKRAEFIARTVKGAQASGRGDVEFLDDDSGKVMEAVLRRDGVEAWRARRVE